MHPLSIPLSPSHRDAAARVLAASIRTPIHVPFPTARRLRALVVAVTASFSAAVTTAGTPADAPPAAWTKRLEKSLDVVDAEHRADIGVYVRDLESGETARYRASETWYLASTVKVPIAIAVLRGVDAGLIDLDSKMTLRAADYVDGAGLTNRQRVGAQLSVRFLLEQMIIYSDNTASDMLIELVGIRNVNHVASEIGGDDFGRITTLGDVRRLVYGELTPAAERLAGNDLLLLHRQQRDKDRLALLARLTETPVAKFRRSSLDEAFSAYYASGVNSARLSTYGDLLEALADGEMLSAKQTDYLLGVMRRTATGTHRIKAGLLPGAQFAHKTGTQRRRICDSGVIKIAHGMHVQRVVIAACARGELSLERAERALRDVGVALCRSGAITRGIPDEPACPPLSRDEVLSAAVPVAPAVPPAVAPAPRAGGNVPASKQRPVAAQPAARPAGSQRTDPAR
ncbi:MAG: serine hydrolase [Moraxellaceae bacterium]|nr:serine hydrolase [Moraxellaceae bacterium]